MRQGEEFWKAHVQAQRQCGQSRVAYAAEHGLSAQSLGWWARKLEAREAGAVATSLAPGFVALRLAASDATTAAPRCVVRAGALELELPGLPPPQWLAGFVHALGQVR